MPNEFVSSVIVVLVFVSSLGLMLHMLLTATTPPSHRDKAPEKKVGYNLMRTYHINVTWDDIRRGIRGDVARCPTGLAMERAGAAGVYFPIESLPEVAQNFIRDFDAGRAVRPIEFIMDDYREVYVKPAYVAQPIPRGEVGRDRRFEPNVAQRVGGGRPERFEPVFMDPPAGYNRRHY